MVQAHDGLRRRGGCHDNAVGLVAIDLFDVSCFEGYCGYLVVLAYAPGGFALGAIAGAVLGWGRRKEVPPR